MTDKTTVYYVNPPERCDVCEDRFTDGNMVDGKTTHGPWGNMCTDCFMKIGVGIGTGKGQQYVREDDGRWRKVAG